MLTLFTTVNALLGALPQSPGLDRRPPTDGRAKQRAQPGSEKSVPIVTPA
jgi:hypothetical protein